MPSTHVHHIHHFGTSPSHQPVYYDYRNSSLSSTPSVRPITYDYKPPTPSNVESSSEERITDSANPNNVLIAGVENLLAYGRMIDNQHQVLFVEQNSDGITLEEELLLTFGGSAFNENDNPQYFPDVEFRFDADDDPNDDDIRNIYDMYKDLVDDGRC